MVLYKVSFYNKRMKSPDIGTFSGISMMMILRMISEKPLGALTRMLWDIFQFQVGY